MTYQVLARKWRPRDFASLVGQDHVVRALTHALEQQRLHHAYLFTGTRGVGKTTLSRILAKALNCEAGITATPCGVCRACVEIDAGRFVDYVEMDAASNRGVDEMAALLERAIYAPVDARFKVYMIDEVHMLTSHAFNAMLKTLEEPPAHVKFILATTDPQKIPVTVLSRCLQFNLKQMPAADIVSHLDKVLGVEGIGFEAQALRLLARAAQGSMRDALSLTDQAIAYAAGTVSEAAVRDMLGTLDQHYLIRLLDAVAAGDGATVLAVADEMATRSLSFSVALQDLAQLLNRIAWAQFTPTSVLDEWPEASEIRRFAASLDAEQIQLFYQIATIGRSELGLAPDEYAGFTMTLLRMLAFRPSQGGISTIAPTRVSAPRETTPALGGAAVAPGPSGAAARDAAIPVPERAPSVAPAAVAAAAGVASDASAAASVVDSRAAPPSTAPAGRHSPARAALEALGMRDGTRGNGSAGRPTMPARRTAVHGGASPQAPRTPETPRGGSAQRDEPARRVKQAQRGEDDAVWEHAPWEDDGAAAFLASAPSLSEVPAPSYAANARAAAPAAASTPVATALPAGIKLSAFGCDDDWPALAARLDVKGLAQQLAFQSELVSVDAENAQLQLRIPVAPLASGAHVDKVAVALSEQLGRAVTLRIDVGPAQLTAAAHQAARKAEQQRRAEAAIQRDPFVQALMQDFDASILPGSTQPLPSLSADRTPATRT